MYESFFGGNVCDCKRELAHTCRDRHSALCSTFSRFLAQLFNEADEEEEDASSAFSHVVRSPLGFSHQGGVGLFPVRLRCAAIAVSAVPRLKISRVQTK